MFAIRKSGWLRQRVSNALKMIGNNSELQKTGCLTGVVALAGWSPIGVPLQVCTMLFASDQIRAGIELGVIVFMRNRNSQNYRVKVGSIHHNLHV